VEDQGSVRHLGVLPEPAESSANYSKRGSTNANAPLHKLISLMLGALSVVLLCFNVALVVQNRSLKARAALPPQALFPQAGMRVSRLDGYAPDGSRVTLTFGADPRKTLLLVFSTSCHICDLNWPAWQSVARSIAGGRYRLVYANTLSRLTDAYVSRHKMSDGVVLAEIDPRTSVNLHLELTPLSILLAPDGTVEHVWPGMLESDELTEISKALIP